MATIRNQTADFLAFSKENGGDGIEFRIDDETICLTQSLMAQLSAVSTSTINEHLNLPGRRT